MNIFVLTGAGLSAESGLGTFRDKDGLWSRFDPACVKTRTGPISTNYLYNFRPTHQGISDQFHLARHKIAPPSDASAFLHIQDPMKLATPGAFARKPDEVHAFYNMRRRNLLSAGPNDAHRALAHLEAGLAERGSLFLVTQNIDDLHERAGSQRALHMHGELLKARCTACSQASSWREDLGVGDPCPHCGRSGTLRPDVVWFGEIPMHMDAIEEGLRQADLFVSIGTSGSVYPAAGFVEQAKHLGIRTYEINLEPSDNAWFFDETHYGPATQTVPAWVERILAA